MSLIRNRENVESYVTKDKSVIRELYHPGSSPVKDVSVAEAYVKACDETEAHVHITSQEIYYIIEGSGTMRLGDSLFGVTTGDAILVPPGMPHNVRAGGNGVRILCICSPPYSHEDTELISRQPTV
jgi:mannose-6-phosphate isomerase-like protein (cupin superfamily)